MERGRSTCSGYLWLTVGLFENNHSLFSVRTCSLGAARDEATATPTQAGVIPMRSEEPCVRRNHLCFLVAEQRRSERALFVVVIGANGIEL